MKLLTITIALLLFGCTNGYTTHYIADATPDIIKSRRAAPPPATPEIIKVYSNNETIIPDLAANGYGQIGHVNFYSSIYWDLVKSEDRAISQGADVGADKLVLCEPTLRSANTISMPLTTPTSSTSYTNGNIYGTGGSLNYNATTTTNGYNTTYTPYTINTYDFCAVYFIKLNTDNTVLGIYIRELTTNEKTLTNSNKGIAVLTVIKQTPAYDADILVNDIITKFEDTPVDKYNFESLLTQYQHKLCKLTIIRNNQTIVKTIQMK